MSEQTQNTQPLTTEEQKKLDAHRAKSIMHAVEVDSSFKLYSYRIISHEQFVDRIGELVENYLNS